MSLYYVNLDERTRQLMLEEVEYDIAHNQLHISPFLSGQGVRDYPNLLREATFASQTLLTGTGDLAGTSFTIDGPVGASLLAAHVTTE